MAEEELQDSLESYAERAHHRKRHMPWAVMSFLRFFRSASMNFDQGTDPRNGEVFFSAWYDPASPTRFMYSMNWQSGNGKRYKIKYHDPNHLLWMAWEVEMDAQGFKPHSDWEKLLEQIESSQGKRNP